MEEFRSELTANLDFRTGLRAGFRADPFRLKWAAWRSESRIESRCATKTYAWRSTRRRQYRQRAA